MRGSKPRALPLGDTPTEAEYFEVLTRKSQPQFYFFKVASVLIALGYNLQRKLRIESELPGEKKFAIG